MKMWAAYGPAITQFKEPYFVTLTVKSVSENRLRPTVQKLHKAFNLCSRALKYHGVELKAFRATEVTYNEEREPKPYHPHIHCLIESRQAAVLLVKAWLKHWKGQATNAAQDIRPADGDHNALREITKYAAKLTGMNRGPDGQRVFVNPVKLDAIFGSIRKLRLWSAVGIRSALAEDVLSEDDVFTDTGTEATKRTEETLTWIWSPGALDWVADDDSGEVLSEWMASERVKSWVKQLGGDEEI